MVACDSDDTVCRLHVRDTGVGIGPDDVPFIFEMFRQLDSSDSRSYGGAGLGLYIVCRMVEQLGGEVTAERLCGNGVLDPDEVCDDGNTAAGDGCDPNCRASACGNGFVAPGEECDGGNTAGGDGCSATCRLECGDGVTDGDERCDDGNRMDGDGCSSRCQRECTGGCDDAEACTVDRCVDGACVHERLPALDELLCAAGELPLLSACATAPASLALAGRAAKLQRFLRRATLKARPEGALRRAARVVARIGNATRALADSGDLSIECADALRERLDALATMIETLHAT